MALPSVNVLVAFVPDNLGGYEEQALGQQSLLADLGKGWETTDKT